MDAVERVKRFVDGRLGILDIWKNDLDFSEDLRTLLARSNGWQDIATLPDKECAVVFYHADGKFDGFPGERYSTGSFEPCPHVEAGFGPCCNGSFDWDDDMPAPTHWRAIEPPLDRLRGSEDG
jgi:hypothetical protein